MFNSFNGFFWELKNDGILKEFVSTDNTEITASNSYGSIINNYGQTDDITKLLPIAVEGMNLLFIAGTTVAKYYRFVPNASDSIYMDGVTTGDGKYVGLTTVTKGDAIQFIAFKTGESTFDWLAVPVMGSWETEA